MLSGRHCLWWTLEVLWAATHTKTLLVIPSMTYDLVSTGYCHTGTFSNTHWILWCSLPHCQWHSKDTANVGAHHYILIRTCTEYRSKWGLGASFPRILEPGRFWGYLAIPLSWIRSTSKHAFGTDVFVLLPIMAYSRMVRSGGSVTLSFGGYRYLFGTVWFKTYAFLAPNLWSTILWWWSTASSC